MGCLILYGWFDTIYISMLPVGHTHEQVDALFSHPRSHYNHNGMYIPTEVVFLFCNLIFSLKLLMRRFGVEH